jgi:hypothetical protein
LGVLFLGVGTAGGLRAMKQPQLVSRGTAVGV